MEQYFEGLKNIAITVCDVDGNILDMNQHSADVNSHGQKIVGYNLMNCHPEPAKTKLKGLLEHRQLNAYTIEKTVVGGQSPATDHQPPTTKVKKLIYQTPWYKEDGQFGGLIEYSIEIPFEMPHFVRQPKPQQ